MNTSECDPVSTTCTNTIVSYRCSCRSGFYTHNTTACRDADECQQNICDNSTTICQNTPGSYNCICKEGFSGFNGRNCSDADECSMNVCDPRTTTCTNTIGSYICSCRSGFQPHNATTCIDIDECQRNICDKSSTDCHNTLGSYNCSCKNGFLGFNGRNCSDADECSMNVCEPGTTTCINTIGSYNCSCRSGFQAHNATACIDKDECHQNVCDKSTTICSNTPGSYNCSCKKGFFGFNGRNCSDADECSMKLCDPETTTCINTIGSYNCSCRSGFQAHNATACIDADECQQNICDKSSTDCLNTPGSYNCSCKKGFLGFNGRNCSDADECQQNIILCDNSTTDCRNTPGSYNCRCKDGFLGFNGRSCSDVDECSMKVCDNDTSTCNNTIGGYNCSCRNGFQAHNLTTCLDIDECQQNICDNSTTVCSNSFGSYNCLCQQGFRSFNGRNCTEDEAHVTTDKRAAVASLFVVAAVAAIAFALIFLCRRRNGSCQSTPNGSCKSQPALNPLQENISINAVQQDSCYSYSAPITVEELATVLRYKISTQGVLDKEFMLVPMETKDTSTVGKNGDHKKKNRFRNIIPYDKNRVLLSQVGGVALSDYINASLIKGYRDTDKLIATQGPLPETINDFWRMICENNVGVIVMITDLKENKKDKCAKYWPDIGTPLTCNEITVRTTSEYLWNGYISRHFQVSKDSKCWDVTHWHFLSYPDHGVPKDVAKFMTFFKKVCSSKMPEKYTVVHCSAGAGRTGTFIAIDYLMQQGNAEGNIDILGCLQRLRNQRPQMIQNLSQYEFVHTALLFEYTVGDTTIPCGIFAARLRELQKKDLYTGISKLEAQLQSLEDRQDHRSEEGKNHILSKYVDKHRPAEMNITIIQSWKGKDAFIILGFPRSSATDDFYSLIKEFDCGAVVFLDGELGTIESLFPTKEKPILLRSSNVLCTCSSKEAYGTCYKISEQKVSNDTYANVAVYANSGEMSPKTEITVLHVTRLANTEFIEFNVLNSIYNCIKKLNVARTQLGPTVVITRVGDAASAFCVAALNAFDMIRDVKEVDIFQIVQDIQKSRPQISFSLLSYNELYYVVDKYIEFDLAAESIPQGPIYGVVMK